MSLLVLELSLALVLATDSQRPAINLSWRIERNSPFVIRSHQGRREASGSGWGSRRAGKKDLPWDPGEGQPGRASGQPATCTRLSKADGMPNGLFMSWWTQAVCREGDFPPSVV